MSWFNITHRNGVARVFIYGEIGTWGIGFEEFERELGDAQNVELRIASMGGDSNTALRIAQLLGERETTACFTGTCCSSAVTLAMTAKRITAHSDARLMAHSPINFCFGNPAELRQQADELEKLIAPIAELYGRRCSPALVEKWFTSGDHWLTAQEALACGLVDEVVSPATLPDRDVALVANTASALIGPTPEEAFVLDLLRIAGPIRVADRERFGRELGTWFAGNVKNL